MILYRPPPLPQPSPEPPAPSTPAPVVTSPTPATKVNVIGPSDDDLWVLLEMVLDGPIQVTRESFAAIQDWMTATRTLLKIKEGT
jgi:hypothetical protein